MSSTLLEQKLATLRQEFDQSFSRAEGGPQPSRLDFLAIVVAGDAYALRLSEVRSLHADRKLVAAPSVLPELRGLCSFRSILTPVYDLAPLLGYGSGRSSARWLVVAEALLPIAFAFEDFDSHLRVSQDSATALLSSSDGGAVGGAVHRLGSSLPLVRLPSLIETIAQRIKTLRPSQGR